MIELGAALFEVAPPFSNLRCSLLARLMAPASSKATAAQQDVAKDDSPQHCEFIEMQTKDDQQNVMTQSSSRRQSTASIDTEASSRLTARFHRNVKRISTKFFRPFKPLDVWIQTRMRRSRFYGWRMGILIGVCSSAFVLSCNILAVAVITSIATENRGPILEIMSGSATSISRWSTALHLVINVFSSLLLAASNYTTQVLCSPTRADLDAAHQKGTWLDVGLLGIRNFRYLPRGRVVLALLLSVSSIPLHLFYNAAVFEVTKFPPTLYKIYAIDAKSDICAFLYSSPEVETFWDDTWLDIYSKAHLSHYGHLYLAIDRFAFGSTSEPEANATSILSRDYVPSDVRALSSEISPINSSPWIDYTNFYPKTVSTNTWPRKARVAQAFAVIIKAQSQLQLSRDFMIVVICFDFLRLIIMLWVLVTDRSDYLVTLGDAVASYLRQPEPMTEGKCMLDKAGHRFILGERTDLGPDVDNHDDFHKRLDGIWAPRKLQCSMLLPEDRQHIFVILFILVLGATTTLPIFMRDWIYEGGGQVSNSINGGVIYNVWLANTPQVLMSFCYLVVNNICTCMASIEEWNGFAHTRKALRVSRPLGEQRETYFLQLPYRYAVPSMLVSIGLHWLLSQAFFLQRVDYVQGDGYPHVLSQCLFTY
ncbi:hypothetical protein DE146DRAFT_702199, partial [Phaeosphaeria sp. MPI-PUGE-AT-0046c]